MADTIDQLPYTVYTRYAAYKTIVEQTNQQFRLDQASSIPPQTMILDLYPKLSELDILLGNIALNPPWALFAPPKKFEIRRKSPFSFSRVVPSLGSQEKQEKDMEILGSIECSTPDEEQEKSTLETCYKQMDKINSMISFIVGRIGQFLQG